MERTFKKWIKNSDREITLLEREIINKRPDKLYPEGLYEHLLQSYLTYRTIRATWILVIITALLGILTTIMNFLILLLK